MRGFFRKQGSTGHKGMCLMGMARYFVVENGPMGCLRTKGSRFFIRVGNCSIEVSVLVKARFIMTVAL